MSGIKSAIELAMERTKGLVMDDEERKSLALKEMENKVKAVLRRYHAGIIESDGVDREMARIEGDGEKKKLILIDRLIDELDFKSKNERLINLLNVIVEDLKEFFKDEMKLMQINYFEEVERKEAKAREKITDHLREMGITGSGVEPNFQEWDEWNECVEETGRAFKGNVIEWKNRLKTANG